MTRVLVDTSVWVSHFRRADPLLQALAAADRLLCHPLVLLELACGTPPEPRAKTLANLKLLARPAVSTNDELLSFIEAERLYGQGCGAVDLALLASARLTPATQLWTADQRLHAVAANLGLAFAGDVH